MAVAADVAVEPEARLAAAALLAVVGPTVVAPSVESAALAAVLVVRLAVAAPLAVLGPKVVRGLPLPKSVRQWSSPSADDLEDLQAAVPASASPERVVLGTRTASGMVLSLRAERKSSPILQ